MATVVERYGQVSLMLAEPLAVTLVSVPWSPWPKRARDVLAALEASRDEWWPESPVAFFDLWPERDAALLQWYKDLCAEHSPQFELHGHGYGPLWWLTSGVIADCLKRPYELPLIQVQGRSRAAFSGTRHRN
jgi:hypothetical protein